MCVYLTDVNGTGGRIFRKCLSTLQMCAVGVAGFRRCVSTCPVCVGMLVGFRCFRHVGEGWQGV